MMERHSWSWLGAEMNDKKSVRASAPFKVLFVPGRESFFHTKDG